MDQSPWRSTEWRAKERAKERTKAKAVALEQNGLVCSTVVVVDVDAQTKAKGRGRQRESQRARRAATKVGLKVERKVQGEER